MTIEPVVCVMHSAFQESRRATLEKLLGRLGKLRVYVHRDEVGQGAWHAALSCWQYGASTDASHVVLMNDDALPCENFETTLKSVLEKAPEEIVSYYVNDDRGKTVWKLGGHWFVTNNGLVGVACSMPTPLVREFVEFATKDILPNSDVTDDGRINLFAMATDRFIFHTVPSLVEHQLPNESLVGNENHEHRVSAVPPTSEMSAYDWTITDRTPFVGLRYRTHSWLITALNARARLKYNGDMKYIRLERQGSFHSPDEVSG